MKKYELLQDDTKTWCERTLHRIKHLSTGELGGYIESEKNLSQYGNAWVFANAHIYGNAEVSGDAVVSGNAKVYGDAKVFANAHIYGNAEVSGDAWVFGNAVVYGNARVCGDAKVFANAHIYGNALVSGNASIRQYDEITATNHYFNIIGFSYPITITHSSIHIGCNDYTFDQLDKIHSHDDISDNEIIRMKTVIEICLDQILDNL